jgi:hypothetical protein
MRSPQIGIGFFGRGAIGWFRRVRDYIRGNRGCAKINILAPAGALGYYWPSGDLGISSSTSLLSVGSVHLAGIVASTASASLYLEVCE